MASRNPGIHNRFDRMLKAFGDEAPRILLHLLEIAPLDSAVAIRRLRPESAPPAVFPDYVLALAVETANPFIFHVEFQYVYNDEVPESMARYGGSLAWQYKKRVISVLVLISRDHAPANVPAIGEYAIFDTVTRHPFRTARLWDLDPEPVIAAGQVRLLPWAAMMKASGAQIETMARIIGKKGDDETKARFLSAASFRYDRNQLEEMLGVSKMGFVEAFMEGSSLIREVKDQARQEGLKKGLEKGLERGLKNGDAKGQLTAARRMVSTLLESQAPGLEKLAAFNAISRVETLEKLALQIARGADPKELKASILAAARKSR